MLPAANFHRLDYLPTVYPLHMFVGKADVSAERIAVSAIAPFKRELQN